MPNCMPKAFRADFMQYSLQACRLSIQLITYLRLIEGAIKGIGVGTGGGGGLPYKSDGYAGRKIQIKPSRETNVGVAQA